MSLFERVRPSFVTELGEKLINGGFRVLAVINDRFPALEGFDKTFFLYIKTDFF